MTTAARIGTWHNRTVLSPSFRELALTAGSSSHDIESGGRLPTNLVADMKAAGVFRCWTPSAYGGTQMTFEEGLAVIDEFAYHDGSTGWCVMIGNLTAILAGFMEPHWAQTVFGPANAVAGGYAMAEGRARVVSGGLRVSGTWSWGSGSAHCTSLGGGSLVIDGDGNPVTLPDGSRTPFVFFDSADVELLDTWQVSGMKGTSSGDYRVTEAFVPDGRWVDVLSRKLQPVIDATLYRFPFYGGFAVAVATVLAGLARRAVDELVAVGGKRPMGSAKSLAHRAVVQADLARADGLVQSSRSFVADAVGEAWQATERGDVTLEHRRVLRLAAATMAEQCIAAIEMCYRCAGGTAIYDTSPLQRVLRDGNVATQHAMIAPRLFEAVGMVRFGVDTDTRMF